MKALKEYVTRAKDNYAQTVGADDEGLQFKVIVLFNSVSDSLYHNAAV